jgi:CO/xanthine dehydrogenase Mo-binding subunit
LTPLLCLLDSCQRSNRLFLLCSQDMELAINPEGAAIQMEGCVTMGGALANAIHDAAGARMRRMPMTPERIREAMSGA